MDPSIGAPTIPRAPYPAPPPFWKHFTTTNAEKLKTIEATQSSDDTTTKPPLPLDLTYLRPPPSPTSDYHTFSTPQPLVTTTTPLPPPDLLLFNPTHPIAHAPLLLKLTKSLLLNFLELITTLGENPNEGTEKMDDIRRIVINLHAVINMYRPHQAREGVREMLQEMLEKGEEEMQRAREVRGRVEGFLRGVEEAGRREVKEVVREGNGEAGEDGESVDKEKREMEEARRMWKAVREIAEG